MTFWVGTSGFSYKPWKGTFYPDGLPDKQMLEFYGQQLRAVEIDNSFYRMPKQSVLESWASQVPEEFRFTLKASRRITHFARLKNADEPMEFLMRNVQTLGDRLGAVLFQLGPKLGKDVERLRNFLPLIPEGVPAAFEFRRESWFDEDVFAALRESGIALCQADTENAKTQTLHSTADWGYLRLRKDNYTDEEIEAWGEKIRSQGWTHAYVFFKHEDGGVGPAWAKKLTEWSDS